MGKNVVLLVTFVCTTPTGSGDEIFHTPAGYDTPCVCFVQKKFKRTPHKKRAILLFTFVCGGMMASWQGHSFAGGGQGRVEHLLSRRRMPLFIYLLRKRW